MNGFVVTSPTPDVVEEIISNEVFWPDIDPGHCRAVIRLDQTITAARLRAAIISAMISANQDLQTWQTAQAEAGYAALVDVPAPVIDGQNIKVSLYTRAVYCFAKAELMERYRDYDTGARGDHRADEMTDSVDDYKRQAIVALRDLTNTARTTVELI